MFGKIFTPQLVRYSIGNGGGGNNLLKIYSAVKIFQPDDVKSLFSNPKIIVPGVPGKTIIPIQAGLGLPFNTTPYGSFGNLYLKFQSANQPINLQNGNDFLFADQETNLLFRFNLGKLNEIQFVDSENLLLGCENGDPLDGDSEVIVTVIYTLL
jgi:hypothetical protein